MSLLLIKSMSKAPKINIDGQDKAANFVSEFHCLHTPHDFILSMIEVIPQMKYTEQDGLNPITKEAIKVAKLQNAGIIQKIVGRYGMSPASFKKLVTVLNQNLKKFEEKYGEIAIRPPEYMH